MQINLSQRNPCWKHNRLILWKQLLCSMTTFSYFIQHFWTFYCIWQIQHWQKSCIKFKTQSWDETFFKVFMNFKVLNFAIKPCSSRHFASNWSKYLNCCVSKVNSLEKQSKNPFQAKKRSRWLRLYEQSLMCCTVQEWRKSKTLINVRGYIFQLFQHLVVFTKSSPWTAHCWWRWLFIPPNRKLAWGSQYRYPTWDT